MKTLADKIRLLRYAMGESQETFAGECELNTKTISQIECENTDPKLSTLHKIARHTNCEIADLLRNDAPATWSYRIREDEIADESGRTRMGYGVEVVEVNQYGVAGKVIRSFPDLSDNRRSMQRFAALCQVSDLYPDQLPEVIDNLLAELGTAR